MGTWGVQWSGVAIWLAGCEGRAVVWGARRLSERGREVGQSQSESQEGHTKRSSRSPGLGGLTPLDGVLDRACAVESREGKEDSSTCSNE